MSRPSIEKRVLPGNVRCRKRSKISTCVMRSSSSRLLIGSSRRTELAASRPPGAATRARRARTRGCSRGRSWRSRSRAAARWPRARWPRPRPPARRRSTPAAARSVVVGQAVRLRVQRRIADRIGRSRADRARAARWPKRRMDSARLKAAMRRGRSVARPTAPAATRRRLIAAGTSCGRRAGRLVDRRGIALVAFVTARDVPGVDPGKLVPRSS